MRPHLGLTATQRERAMRLSLFDGVLFALMIGGAETYAIALAVRLGATPLEIGLVTALPLLIGSLGPLGVLRLLGSYPHRRPLVAACAVLQGLVLVAIGLLSRAHELTPALLIALLAVFQFGGQGAGVAWSSWYGDLVPIKMRGGYFTKRTRLVHAGTFVGLAAGGVVLELLEPAPAAIGDVGGLGFAIVFCGAGIFRLASAAVLAASPEPRFGGLPPPAQALRFLTTARGRNAWRLVLGSAAFQLGIYVAAPYFAPFVLDELRLSYLLFMAGLAGQVVIKVITMPFWGRLVDRGPRRAFVVAMLLSALIPLPWLFVGGAPGMIASYVFAGFAWGGFEVALFAMLLDSTVPRTRPLVFAAQNLVNGTAQVTGGLAGAAMLAGSGSFQVLFVASLAARLVIAIVLPMFVRELVLVGRTGPRVLPLRVVGFRPGTGTVHRPMLEPAETEAPEDDERP